MKRVCTATSSAFLGSGGISRKIQIPCTEEDILYLEYICMTPGVHNIRVPSLVGGRQALISVLQALSWHQDVGYITVDDRSVIEYGTNITRCLQLPLDQEQLESFFINSFYFDCLWVELFPAIRKMRWLSRFESQLFAYKFDQMIPVILLEV